MKELNEPEIKPVHDWVGATAPARCCRYGPGVSGRAR